MPLSYSLWPGLPDRMVKFFGDLRLAVRDVSSRSTDSETSFMLRGPVTPWWQFGGATKLLFGRCWYWVNYPLDVMSLWKSMVALPEWTCLTVLRFWEFDDLIVLNLLKYFCFLDDFLASTFAYSSSFYLAIFFAIIGCLWSLSCMF